MRRTCKMARKNSSLKNKCQTKEHTRSIRKIPMQMKKWKLNKTLKIQSKALFVAFSNKNRKRFVPKWKNFILPITWLTGQPLKGELILNITEALNVKCLLINSFKLNLFPKHSSNANQQEKGTFLSSIWCIEVKLLTQEPLKEKFRSKK